MSSFYGNLKNNSRASFIFDKIYPTRKAMDDANNNQGDGIFVNRFVLVDYRYAYIDSLQNNDISASFYYEQVTNVGTYINVSNYTNFYYLESESGQYKKYSSSVPFSQSNTYYQRKVYIDRMIPNSVSNDIRDSEEHPIYAKHRLEDLRQYHMNYDLTVWMKVYLDGIEKYILVADLKARAPSFEVITDAPGCEIGGPHIDPKESSDLQYVYYAPKSWNVLMNQYNPSKNYSDINTNEYWRYEQDKNPKTFDNTVKYPYFNQEGFNPQVSNHKIIDEQSDLQEGVFLTQSRSLSLYPKHKFSVAGYVIKDDFTPHRYYKYIGLKEDVGSNPTIDPDIAYYRKNNGNYIYVPVFKGPNNTYILSDGGNSGTVYSYDSETNKPENFEPIDEWQPDIAYYELVWARDPQNNNQRLNDHVEDTQRIDIYLPSLGNAVADIYDVMYGKPTIVTADQTGHISGYSNFVGYCTDAQLVDFQNGQPSNDDDNSESAYRKQNGIDCTIKYYLNEQINERQYYLTEADLDSLSLEEVGLYKNPVYAKDDSNIRPYSANKILRPVSEFDTLNEILSLGSMTSDLKKQLSVLNALIVDENAVLKANWTEQDSVYGIGYILNKPQIINSYVETGDTTVLNKTYYMKRYANDGTGNIEFDTDSQPVSNPYAEGFYELLDLPETGSAYRATSYELATEYNGTGIYYDINGNRVGTESTPEESYTSITADTDSGNVYDIAKYDIRANGDAITGHNYYLQAAPKILNNSEFYQRITYLFYNDKPVSVIKIKINNADIWEPILTIKNKNQQQILEILNGLSSNEFECTNFAGYENINTNISTSGFSYVQYIYRKTLLVSEEDFRPNTYYYRTSVSLNASDFEIHNIWNKISARVLSE